MPAASYGWLLSPSRHARDVLVNLAYPKIPWRLRQESLGLVYLAAVARRAGHDVDVIGASPCGRTAGRILYQELVSPPCLSLPTSAGPALPGTS